MYIQPKIEERVKYFLDIPGKHMGDTIGIDFTSFKTDEIKATMPINEHTVQPFGLLHGGASVALAETLSSVGAWLNIEDHNKTAVGIEINANHIRAVKKGATVEGVATPIHKGQQTQVWETKIYTPENKLACVSRCTLAVVNGE